MKTLLSTKLLRFGLVFCLVITTLFLASCNSPTLPTNTAPVFTSNLPSTAAIQIGASLRLSVVATDKDGDMLTYTWKEATVGTDLKTVGTNSSSYSFSKGSAGPWLVKVIVEDGRGGSAESVFCRVDVTAAPTFTVSLEDFGGPFAAPAEVAFDVNASYSAGTISNIGIYAGETKMGDASLVSGTLWRYYAHAIAEGTYTIKAKATASDSTVKESAERVLTVTRAYSVTYDGNGNTGGSVPTDTNSYASGATVTVKGNEGGLVKTGYNFSGWNSKTDGTGTTYQEGAPFIITEDSTLYAQWAVCRVIAVAAGFGHSHILKDDGTLWATGRNWEGQLGDGTTINRLSPVQIMNDVTAIDAHSWGSLVLKKDSSLWRTGNSSTIPLQVMSGVKAMAIGSNRSLIITEDGTLWGVGGNSHGELGDGTTTDRSIPVQIMNGVKAVATDEFHSLILKEDGSLLTTGANYWGQLGDGTNTLRSTPVQIMSDVKAIAAGIRHSLFLKNDGTLWGAGSNSAGQLGDSTGIDRSSPIKIMNDVKAIAAGGLQSFILKVDGTLWATGMNDRGQLGDGTTSTRYIPRKIMSNVKAIEAGAGYKHSLMVKEDGTLWATGENDSGQLGDGTDTTRLSPVQIFVQ